MDCPPGVACQAQARRIWRTAAWRTWKLAGARPNHDVGNPRQYKADLKEQGGPKGFVKWGPERGTSVRLTSSLTAAGRASSTAVSPSTVWIDATVPHRCELPARLAYRPRAARGSSMTTTPAARSCNPLRWRFRTAAPPMTTIARTTASGRKVPTTWMIPSKARYRRADLIHPGSPLAPSWTTWTPAIQAPSVCP